MCILFLYANGRPVSGGYKLIVASNRDWYYSRPSIHARQWKDFPHVFGGLDMEVGKEGGTWLAVSGKNKTIKFGALLSVTGESCRDDGKAGRGFIVRDYVVGNTPNTEYCDSLAPFNNVISAYNFISVEFVDQSARIIHCSNNPPTQCKYEEGQCYGFGNSPPTTPFEKVKYCQDLFKTIVHDLQDSRQPTKQEIVERCMKLLKDRKKCWPDEELARRAPLLGEFMCSAHVEIPRSRCGTRARTVILIDTNNKMDFIEEAMSTENPNNKWNLTHIEHKFV